MRIKPNRVILEGRVERVVPAADGFGAEVEFAVSGSAPAEGFEDFLGAESGATLTLFAADPAEIKPGRSYRITASVIGGPQGERAVIQTVERA